jgi:Domain of unknown function (DUF6249)
MTRLAPLVRPPSTAFRRVVLAIAFLFALAVWLVPKSAPVQAQETRNPAGASSVPPASAKASEGGKKSVDTRISITSHGIEVKTPSTSDEPAAPDAEVPPSETDGGSHTITIEKGRKRVHVTGSGRDHEFDSFDDFVNHDPPAIMIVAIVAVIFLSPVLVVALILVYRMRKARMLNETMLKLAEKGIVPPAEALGALAGNTAAAMAASPGVASIYEQARQMRRHAAWSDLRKGIIMGGAGLGLTAFSMFDDKTPNGLGLVLLFVGIGYVVLWWFEQRQIAPRPGADGGPAPGA